MLAKKTTKNQITLPKKVVARFTGVEYFDVSTDGACIILRPLQKSRADEVRARLSQLGIEDADVTAAISWARKHAWSLTQRSLCRHCYLRAAAWLGCVRIGVQEVSCHWLLAPPLRNSPGYCDIQSFNFPPITGMNYWRSTFPIAK
jgi:hypothetical protein